MIELKEDDTLYFVHIRKTGGTTLLTILDNNFRRNEILRLREWAEIESKAPIDFSKYHLIRGHFGYRLCRLLPKKPVLMTMLRDPVDHVISNFNHQKREQKNELVKKVYTDKSLEDILTHPGEGLKYLNIQVRELANDRLGEEIYKEFKEKDALQIAKERLEEFAFIGLLERYQESLYLLAFTFGWVPIKSVKAKNTAPESNLKKAQVSDTMMKKILELTELDRQLYSYAKEIFEKRYRFMVAQLRLKYYRPELERFNDSDAVYEMLQRWYSEIYEKKHPMMFHKLSVDFDDALNGWEWQDREISPVMKTFRWTGPETRSIIDLPLKRDNDLGITIKLTGYITEEILQSFRLKVNDDKNLIKLTMKKLHTNLKFVEFEGIIPKSYLQSQYSFTRLILEVSKTMMPKSVNPNLGDDRLLGLAVSNIEIK